MSWPLGRAIARSLSSEKPHGATIEAFTIICFMFVVELKVCFKSI